MPRVLLVEDEDDQRNLYKDSFICAGFEVFAAKNGIEALELFKANRPDAVVLDIHLPGMDGIEALRRILSEDRTAVVAFYSAYPAFKSNFMTWAADAFVMKTGDPAEIVTQINTLLAERGLISAKGV